MAAAGNAGGAVEVTATHATAARAWPPLSCTEARPTRVFGGDGQAFAAALMGIHEVVSTSDRPNFLGARILVPSNFNLHSWENICVTPDDRLILQYLQFGFPAGYEGPVPTPSFHNHPSAV